MTFSFGPEWQSDIWASPYWLRFELADGAYLSSYVTRFTNSFDRARRLARMALPTKNIIGIIAAYPDPSLEMSAEWHEWTTGTGFEHLEKLGVSTDVALASWRGYWWPDEDADPEVEPWDQRAVSLTWEEADVLLWNQIAQDLGVAPRAPVFAKLVDLERGICVNAYDDRGMDIIALTKEPLVSLYEECNDWLLDYDRARMAAVFES